MNSSKKYQQQKYFKFFMISRARCLCAMFKKSFIAVDFHTTIDRQCKDYLENLN